MSNRTDLEIIARQLEEDLNAYEQPLSKLDEMLTFKDSIAAFRDRGASYKSIAERLRNRGFPTSAAMVGKFCKAHLGEKAKSRKKRRSRSENRPKGKPIEVSPKSSQQPRDESETKPVSTSPLSRPRQRRRGPRIADVNTL